MSQCRLEGNIQWILKIWGERAMCLIELAHDKDRWRAVVNAVMNLQVP